MTTWAWFRNLPAWAKAGVALGGGLLIGSATFLALQASGGGARSQDERQRRRRSEAKRDDSSNDVVAGRRILVLGLSGAGKSSILSRLTKVESAGGRTAPIGGSGHHSSSTPVQPTDGFSVICLHTTAGTLNIWEIGGTDKNRAYWENFVRDTDLLVYVVDSSDDDRALDVAVAEFRKLIADARLKDVPVLLLANKQDAPGAKNQFEVAKVFGCEGGTVGGHSLRVLGTRAPAHLPSHPSIGEAERLIIAMSNHSVRCATK